MNYSDPVLRESAKYGVLDILLADVAIRIQLSPTDYQKAVDHYEAINEWIDRQDSPLHKRVKLFYPQGGFMIAATTARHSTDADFDIDIMAEITWPADIDPEVALSTLHKAIRGEPGSRYYKQSERKTRCSTVNYEGMHLDVTPAVRIAGTSEKTSFIFHSKPSEGKKATLYANPYGFGQWFTNLTPPDQAFGEFFEKRSLDYERARLTPLAKADADAVPVQLPVYRKSRALICLQLIKRWRNLAYDARHAELRLPPSVLLAFYVASNANRTRSLIDELLYQVECIIAELKTADDAARLVYAVNPTCPQDVLTDRWPATRQDQRTFFEELSIFAAKLRLLKQGVPLPQMQKILEELFGERPAQGAVRKYLDQQNSDNKAGKNFYTLGTGAIPALGSVAVPPSARATPRSSPWGD